MIRKAARRVEFFHVVEYDANGNLTSKEFMEENCAWNEYRGAIFNATLNLGGEKMIVLKSEDRILSTFAVCR